MSYWYACSQPEREPDPNVVWHYEDCPTCRFKMGVQVARNPGDEVVGRVARNLFGIDPANPMGRAV
jgi:hypothetical protein